jgi:hypothetical protein
MVQSAARRVCEASPATPAALLALSLLVVTAIWLGTGLVERNRGFDSDGVSYAAMAGEPTLPAAAARVAPYCWRVLTPFLASLLPLPTLAAFRALAFASDVASLVLLGLLLERLRFSRRVTALGVLLYAGVFWTVKFSFYSPAYIDFQTQLLLLAVLYAVESRRFAILPPLLAVAVLQKETALVALPFVALAYASQHGWRPARSLGYLVALAAMPVLALGAVRLAIQPLHDNTVAGASGRIVAQLLSADFAPRFALATASGLGVLPLVIAVRARAARAFLREHPHWWWWVIAAPALLFGGVDKSRLFLHALPLAVVLASSGIQSLARERRGVVVWALATLGVQLYLGHHLEPLASYADYVARLVPEHAPGGTWREPALATALALAGWLAATLLWLRATDRSPTPR